MINFINEINSQKVSVEVRQLEFYLLSLEKIKAVCGQDPMNQTQINSIYFMYDNQLIIQSNSRGFIQKNIDKQNEIIDQLQLNIFLIAIVTSVVSVIASILTIPLMKSINKFQEIIYFVLSRTTFEEAEREISKLELFHKNLMDKDNSWIEYNFCSDFILERANNRINSKEGSITAHSTQASQISQRQKRISSKTQQQHISSKIRDQKLSFIKYFLQLSFFGLTAVCFLAASIIFFQQEKSYLKEQLEVFNTTMKTKLCFHSIITLSEITFRKDIIQQFDTNFPFDQYSEVISIFNKDLSILSSYTTYMSSAIQNKKIFENQHMSNLQKLFNSNLCDQFPDQELCSSSNQSTIKQQANNGFFSVISSYLNYFQQFNKLLQSRLSKDEITQLSWDYSSLDQYKYLIAQGFSLPVETFNLIQNQLYTLIVDLINLIQQFYTLYMVIGEITLIVIWLIFSAYLKQKINLDIQSAQFALTCLPFQKAQEETTIYLLKSIFKY